MKTVSADVAVQVIQSGHRVFVHEAAMAPISLLEALARRAPELQGVEVVHLHLNTPAPHLAPSLAGHLRHNALFVGPNARDAVAEGRADFTPVFLSEVPLLFEDGTLPLDVALVQVSPPNRHGFCRLGVSVAAARSAVDHARVVIRRDQQESAAHRRSHRDSHRQDSLRSGGGSTSPRARRGRAWRHRKANRFVDRGTRSRWRNSSDGHRLDPRCCAE